MAAILVYDVEQVAFIHAFMKYVWKKIPRGLPQYKDAVLPV